MSALLQPTDLTQSRLLPLASARRNPVGPAAARRPRRERSQGSPRGHQGWLEVRQGGDAPLPGESGHAQAGQVVRSVVRCIAALNPDVPRRGNVQSTNKVAGSFGPRAFEGQGN